jgi:hypothetical protein
MLRDQSRRYAKSPMCEFIAREPKYGFQLATLGYTFLRVPHLWRLKRT